MSFKHDASRPAPGAPWRERLACLAATLGPVGLAPKAPGTFGSLAAAVLAPWLFLPLSLSGRLAVLALVFALGALAAGRAEKAMARTDPGCIVIDELAGQWTAFLFLPQDRLWPLAAGFALFRIFDILKPGPIRAVERRLSGGFGIMADDVLAGLAAAACLAAATALGLG